MCIRDRGYPDDYHPDLFNVSEDTAFKKLAETYHFSETWDEYYYNDMEYHILTKGTHASVYSFLEPVQLKLGKWWSSTEPIPGLIPYGVWVTRINWYLNEVIFAMISFLFMNTILNFLLQEFTMHLMKFQEVE